MTNRQTPTRKSPSPRRASPGPCRPRESRAWPPQTPPRRAGPRSWRRSPRRAASSASCVPAHGHGGSRVLPRWLSNFALLGGRRVWCIHPARGGARGGQRAGWWEQPSRVWLGASGRCVRCGVRCGGGPGSVTRGEGSSMALRERGDGGRQVRERREPAFCVLKDGRKIWSRQISTRLADATIKP